MTPEQERALALARARQRKAQAEASGQTTSKSKLGADINTAMANRGLSPDQAPSPQMRASLPGATEPDRMQNRTDSAVLAKARKVEADIANATRKARVRPVEREAGRAGRAELDQGNIDVNPNVYLGAGSEFMLPPDAQRGLEAEREVYRANDVTSSVDAAIIRGLNSLALGIPAMVNEDFRNEVGAAGRDQPGASLAGDIAGYLLPGELAWQAGRTAYNATLKPVFNALAPKGGSAFARGARLGQRGVEQAGAWAGQNALMQGTVGASTAAAEEGRPVTLEDITSGAEAGATDPINMLGPAALIGANRVGKFITSGGRTATPDSIAAEIAGRTAGRSGDGSILDAGMLGGDVDRRAETILLRMLRDAGFSNNDIRGGLATFKQVAQSLPDGPVLTSRLKDVLIDKLGPRAEQVVQDFLQGAGVSRGGTAGQAVASAAAEDYGRLGQFLEDSANARLGAGSRYDTLTAAEQEMSRIGKEGYERVFSAPAPDAAAVDGLRQALDFFAGSELATPLRQIAAGKMLNVEQMIANDPRRAAHWMQMAANTKAKEAFDAGNKVLGNAYTDMRDQILSRLEVDGVAPGYQQARMKFGDEFGIEQAITFGSRFFTKVTDTVGVRQLADDLRNLTPEQQEAALLSIRDELLRLAGRGRSGAAPRLTQLNTDASLGGLETVVGEKGGQLANDIRFIDERLARVRRTDPGQNSRTASNQEARAFADRAVSNPVVRTVGNALKAIGGDTILTSGTGSFTPIMMARGLANKAGESLARGRQGKIDDVTSLLLRDVGPSPRPPMPGDDMLPLTSRGGAGGAAPPNALSGEQQVTPAQPTRSFSRDEAGFVNYPVTNALLGGSGGAVAGSFNDINQDGKQNWEDQVAGGLLGIAGMYGVQKAGDAIAPLIPKGYVDRLNATKTLSEAADFLARERFKPAKRIEREATEADWDEALTEASQALRQTAERQGTASQIGSEMVPDSLTDPAGKPRLVYEDLAAQILRSKGIDPDPVYKALLNERGTNAENATFSKVLGYETGQLKARERGEVALDQMDDTDAAIEYMASLSNKPSRLNGLPGLRTDAGNALVGSTVGGFTGLNNDLNGDGVIDIEDQRLGALVGLVGLPVGVRATNAMSRSLGRNALAGETRTAGLFGRKSPPAPPPAAPGRTPRNQRFETLRFMVQRQNPGLADDQIDALAEQQYRSIYERPAPGAQMTERDFAQGWERAVREAKQSLDETAGPGNYTAADVEAEAVASYSQTFPGGRGLPEDTMALPLTVAQDGARTMSRGRTYVFEVNGKAFTGATPEEAARRAGDLSPAMGNMENRPTVRKYAIEEDGTQVPYDEAIRSRPKAPPASPESEFARLVTAEQRLNAPARELTEGDLIRLAEPYAKAYAAKGGHGASDIERAAYEVVQRMGGGSESPIRAGGFAGGGGRKPRAPKPDSPEAIKAAVKQIAKPKPEPTRLERMVEEGKGAAVPPADPVMGETNQLAAQATRMMERGDGVFKVHDKTGIVMIPYNGSNVPLYAPDIGPEEVIRRFYEALRLPAAERPEWVRGVLSQAKAKPGLLLTERNIAPPDMVPPPASAVPEQPLPKNGIPYGAIAGGALAGALTGIGGGGAAIMGYQMLQDRNRPRNALSGQ